MAPTQAPQVFNAANAKVGMVISEADQNQHFTGSRFEVVEIDPNTNLICVIDCDYEGAGTQWQGEVEGWKS
jgi:hypothetical protein